MRAKDAFPLDLFGELPNDRRFVLPDDVGQFGTELMMRFPGGLDGDHSFSRTLFAQFP